MQHVLCLGFSGDELDVATWQRLDEICDKRTLVGSLTEVATGEMGGGRRPIS